MATAITNLETETATLSPQAELDRLAGEIHELDRQSTAHAGNLVQSKVEIGERLIAAKSLLPHGQFLPWTKAQFGWSCKHVSRHMKLASNVTRVSHLAEMSFRAALAAIGEPVEGDGESDDSMDVHYSSESPEWYTPPEIINRTLALLDAIDLDPCSNSGPDANIPAAQRFTEEDDGLVQPWAGRVYMNPPYGRAIVEWVDKLVSEYGSGSVTEAVALVPARVDTEWFRKFRDYAVCFVDGRLKFSGHENSAPFPSAVIYLGPRLDAFYDAFSEAGDVWVRWKK